MELFLMNLPHTKKMNQDNNSNNNNKKERKKEKKQKTPQKTNEYANTEKLQWRSKDLQHLRMIK